ncbi:MAG: response regulator [Caldilineae bacterium]|nr:MAG: response regulator [Caldilineae bacterium]
MRVWSRRFNINLLKTVRGRLIIGLLPGLFALITLLAIGLLATDILVRANAHLVDAGWELAATRTLQLPAQQELALFRLGQEALSNVVKHAESEADSPTSVEEQIAQQRPDVVLLDVRLGRYDGIQIARNLRRTHPHCRVIILTTYDDDDYLFGALEAGAHAYLLKDVSLDELPASIRAVHAGKRLLSPLLMDRVLTEFQQMAAERVAEAHGIGQEERELLVLMADGLTNREIAERLNYSEATVKKKVQELLETMGVANRTQAVAMAIRQGLI